MLPGRVSRLNQVEGTQLSFDTSTTTTTPCPTNPSRGANAVVDARRGVRTLPQPCRTAGHRYCPAPPPPPSCRPDLSHLLHPLCRRRLMVGVISQHLLSSEMQSLETQLARLRMPVAESSTAMRLQIGAVHAQTAADCKHLEVTLQAARCEHTAADTALQSALDATGDLLREAATRLFMAQDALSQMGGPGIEQLHRMGAVDGPLQLDRLAAPAGLKPEALPPPPPQGSAPSLMPPPGCVAFPYATAQALRETATYEVAATHEAATHEAATREAMTHEHETTSALRSPGPSGAARHATYASDSPPGIEGSSGGSSSLDAAAIRAAALSLTASRSPPLDSYSSSELVTGGGGVLTSGGAFALAESAGAAGEAFCDIGCAPSELSASQNRAFASALAFAIEATSGVNVPARAPTAGLQTAVSRAALSRASEGGDGADVQRAAEGAGYRLPAAAAEGGASTHGVAPPGTGVCIAGRPGGVVFQVGLGNEGSDGYGGGGGGGAGAGGGAEGACVGSSAASRAPSAVQGAGDRVRERPSSSEEPFGRSSDGWLPLPPAYAHHSVTSSCSQPHNGRHPNPAGWLTPQGAEGRASAYATPRGATGSMATGRATPRRSLSWDRRGSSHSYGSHAAMNNNPKSPSGKRPPHPRFVGLPQAPQRTQPAPPAPSVNGTVDGSVGGFSAGLTHTPTTTMAVNPCGAYTAGAASPNGVGDGGGARLGGLVAPTPSPHLVFRPTPDGQLKLVRSQP